MKKIELLLFALLMLSISCQKAQSEIKQQTTTVETITNFSKSTVSYLITFQSGHSGKGCSGCVFDHGKWIHIDCQGYGNLCELQSQITLTQVDENLFSATTTDSTELTDGDLFNMPARSLFVKFDNDKNKVWLNIPAQLVYRDSSTRQFVFNGLYYSDIAAYGND